MLVSIDSLRSLVLSKFQDRYTTADTERMADVIMWADLAGVGTQGVIKLTGTEPVQAVVPTGEIAVVRETDVSALLDGHSNPGFLAAQVATDLAIQKATKSGISIVAVHNIFTSTGTQAFYATRMAEAGLIGIAQSRSPAAISAFGGIDPLFGTNPIAFGFPTTAEPLVFDMATSAMTWYGLVLAEAQGRPIPPDMAINSDGNPTTDPTAAMNGALLPFDRSYKGAGLAMVVELLGGVLSGSSYGQIDGDWGASFIAIDAEVLIGRDKFKRRCSDLVDKARAARRGEGQTIRLPGERAAKTYAESVRSGTVEVDDAILERLGYSAT